jgi:predicted acylesterase/phospholipase RssA
MGNARTIGLALSGGGYRASLFHLGAMRRLNELGILEKVGCISSVSGGSILSGFIADKMLAADQNTPQFDDWETSVAHAFRGFVSKDIRTFLILRYVLINAVKPQKRAARLAEVFRERLTDRYLTDLPKEGEGTSFMFLATDFLESVAWEFEQHRVGNYKMKNKGRLPSDRISIAQAVAASASFPPIFGPVRLPVKKRNSNEEHVAWLTDGGSTTISACSPFGMISGTAACWFQMGVAFSKECSRSPTEAGFFGIRPLPWIRCAPVGNGN